MPRFKKILLVASAGADVPSALVRALALAKANRSQIKVYDVLESLPREAKKLYKSIGKKKLERRLVRKRREELKAIIAETEVHGVRIRVDVGIGTSFIEIIREVLRNGHDLVVKPAVTDGRSAPPGFGSTDLHLIRECPCAVWLVKPMQSTEHSRILAAVDPDPSDQHRSLLNDSIMELAISLSKVGDADLHVVHSWTLYNETLLHLLVGNLDKLARSTRRTHRRWLNALVEKFSMVKGDARIHLVKGPARETIPKLAREMHIDLIVMGTAARSGVPRFLIGNTAEDVLNQVDCSVIAVKAKGFVSPVTLKK